MPIRRALVGGESGLGGSSFRMSFSGPLADFETERGIRIRYRVQRTRRNHGSLLRVRKVFGCRVDTLARQTNLWTNHHLPARIPTTFVEVIGLDVLHISSVTQKS